MADPLITSRPLLAYVSRHDEAVAPPGIAEQVAPADLGPGTS